MQENDSNYVIRTGLQPCDFHSSEWDALLGRQDQPTPFMRHAYLQALHDSDSACSDTGWTPTFVGIWHEDTLVAACPLYLKDHSYGEYVFDWAWADAYQRHGLRYYPKAVVAVPFAVAVCTVMREALVAERVTVRRTVVVPELPSTIQARPAEKPTVGSDAAPDRREGPTSRREIGRAHV